MLGAHPYFFRHKRIIDVLKPTSVVIVGWEIYVVLMDHLFGFTVILKHIEDEVP
jgi:hypothetical protein